MNCYDLTVTFRRHDAEISLDYYGAQAKLKGHAREKEKEVEKKGKINLKLDSTCYTTNYHINSSCSIFKITKCRAK